VPRDSPKRPVLEGINQGVGRRYYVESLERLLLLDEIRRNEDQTGQINRGTVGVRSTRLTQHVVFVCKSTVTSTFCYSRSRKKNM